MGGEKGEGQGTTIRGYKKTEKEKDFTMNSKSSILNSRDETKGTMNALFGGGAKRKNKQKKTEGSDAPH